PKKDEYEHFKEILANLRTLPASFVRDIILKKPSKDMMNVLARCVLSMYPYDDNPDDLSIENLIEQSLKLIAQFPLMSVYGYNAYIHYHDEASLIIHQPSKDLSTAENILHCLRPDSSYTKLEARLLDICLILHAEHGGGNNSTFTTHVVSSSGTDTYSTIAAALGSLKGPKHGGANIKVVKMFDDMKATLKEDYSDEKVNQYLNDLLDRKAFDGSGLIYGMGHAVYTKSDPRAKVLKRFIKSLAEEKNLQKDYELYKQVERLAPEIINDKRKIYKGVSANIDFYSGFVYKMLDIPVELYTPIFAIARVVGWCSHRIEEIVNSGKIIRPAYIYTAEHLDYKPIAER
ncbi:MAG: citrate synthase, partial [Clostridia bacterium]